MKKAFLFIFLLIPLLLFCQTRKIWIDSLYVKQGDGSYKKVQLQETFGDTSLSGLGEMSLYDYIETYYYPPGSGSGSGYPPDSVWLFLTSGDSLTVGDTIKTSVEKTDKMYLTGNNIVISETLPYSSWNDATMNVGIGYNSLYDIYNGVRNVGIGENSLQNLTDGSGNVALGSHALNNTSTGDYNIGIGRSGGYGVTTGTRNIGIGFETLEDNATANDNIAIGHQAFKNTTASGGVAIGYQALYNSISGVSNTAVGYKSFTTTTGERNTGLGYSSGEVSTGGSDNTAIGFRALRSVYSNSSYNTAVGSYANSEGSTSVRNTAVGYGALRTITAGHNTVVGAYSLYSATSSSYTTVVGCSAGISLSSGGYNTIVGSLAFESASSGSYNVAMGMGSLRYLTTSEYNTALGYYAGSYRVSGTSQNVPGNNNIYLGSFSRSSGNSLSNEIVIGANATGNGSNSVTLGDINIVKTVLRAKVGIGTVSPSKALEVVGGAKIDTVIHSRNNIVVDPVRMVFTNWTQSTTGSDADKLPPTSLLMVEDVDFTWLRFNFMRFPGEDTLFIDFEESTDSLAKEYEIYTYYYLADSVYYNNAPDSVAFGGGDSRNAQVTSPNYRRASPLERKPLTSLEYFTHYEIIIRYSSAAAVEHYLRRPLIYVR